MLLLWLKLTSYCYPLLCSFKATPLVLSKTLSQMWDKLNLPILLLSVGLLTLM